VRRRRRLCQDKRYGDEPAAVVVNGSSINDTGGGSRNYGSGSGHDGSGSGHDGSGRCHSTGERSNNR
jgi:hypothetical protein